MQTGRAAQLTCILLVDLDLIVDHDWLEQYRHIVYLILDWYGLTATAIRVTQSQRRGYHVRIYLSKPVSAHTALLLQWLLLDDHARTDFNRARVQVGYPNWNKLFEPVDWNHRRHHSSCKNKIRQGRR